MTDQTFGLFLVPLGHYFVDGGDTTLDFHMSLFREKTQTWSDKTKSGVYKRLTEEIRGRRKVKTFK